MACNEKYDMIFNGAALSQIMTTLQRLKNVR